MRAVWNSLKQRNNKRIKRARELRGDIPFYLSVVKLIDTKYATPPSAPYVSVLYRYIDRIRQNDIKYVICVPIENARII